MTAHLKTVIEIKDLIFNYTDEEHKVFSQLNLQIPSGLISFIGQNGIGKSTLMLLAGARLFPESGSVKLFGVDTKSLTDEERNRDISFIYQNLEFESDEKIGDLLGFVYDNGFTQNKERQIISDLIKTFELSNILHKKTQCISKGELQRTIIAFGLLYGSKLLIMDEPIFALEDKQKEKIMEYLADYSRSSRTSIYYSVHELDISRKYSDLVLLFQKNQEFIIGKPDKVLTEENLEATFEVPYSMLYEKEILFRKHLLEVDEHIIKGE